MGSTATKRLADMKRLQNNPPRWTARMLRTLCKPEVLEELEGDLLEFYDLWLEEYGPAKARRLYILHSIKALRPYALKSIKPTTQKSNLMLDYNLKIAWRNLRKSKGYAVINVVGLSLGIASSLLIYLWTSKELATDKFHSDSERIYGVYYREVFPGGLAAIRNTPAKLPAELKETIPEIEYATGFAKSFRLSLQGVTAETFEKDDVILKMKGSRASPQFFKLFSFDVLEGQSDNALLDRSHIAISRKMAEIFFGSPAEAINQTIRYQNEKDLIVSLVFEDIGDESSLKFDYLTNWDAWVDGDEFKPSWGHFGTQTYVKLKAGADPLAVEEKMKSILSNYLDFDEGTNGELGLQRFSDQYLYGNFENGRPAPGRIDSVRVFQAIAIFIIVIAIINFVNLQTANATDRAKEVGVRKVIGATKLTLRSQFLTESLMLTTISVGLALLIVWTLLPAFRVVTQASLALPILDPVFVLGLVGMTLLIALLAGIYPALVLSGIKLLSALQKGDSNSARTGFVRKGLVVFQFALSIFLTVATIVVGSQMNYLLDKDLGFERSDLVYLPIEGTLVDNYQLFKQEASEVPGVLMVDRSSQTPHKMGFSGPFLGWDGKEDGNNTPFTPSSVGFDFVETMQLEIVEGRDFDRSRPVDQNNFIINETAAEVMGGDVINRTAAIFGKQGKIVGVVKDFHFKSLHNPIEPLVLDVKEGLNFGTVLVRLERDKIGETLVALQDVYGTVNPGYAFDYRFVDNVYGDDYQSEKLIASLIPYFAGLAIFISCLGLLGLVTFATQRRVKEVGIRKVLGASVRQILHMLSKDFALLLVIAFVVSLPLSYALTNGWLDGFAYRIGLDWWIFALAAVLTIVMSYGIIVGKVLKSAHVNPVDCLRDE